MSSIGAYVIPVIIGIILIFGFVKRVAVFDTFIIGAKQGIKTAITILPTLVGLIVAVNMFKASGAMEILINLLSPILNKIGFPSEVIPLILLRPFSGSGTIAVCDSIFESYSVDSYIGKIASVMVGSGETTFYAIAVYFGSLGIKNIRHTVVSALTADIFGYVASVLLVGIFFSF